LTSSDPGSPSINAQLLKRALVRRYKSISPAKRRSWSKRFDKDGVHEQELARLMKVVTPGKAVQVRLGNIMTLHDDENLPRKISRALL
jgi:hypothetical protein